MIPEICMFDSSVCQIPGPQTAANTDRATFRISPSPPSWFFSRLKWQLFLGFFKFYSSQYAFIALLRKPAEYCVSFIIVTSHLLTILEEEWTFSMSRCTGDHFATPPPPFYPTHPPCSVMLLCYLLSTSDNINLSMCVCVCVFGLPGDAGWTRWRGVPLNPQQTLKAEMVRPVGKDAFKTREKLILGFDWHSSRVSWKLLRHLGNISPVTCVTTEVNTYLNTSSLPSESFRSVSSYHCCRHFDSVFFFLTTASVVMNLVALMNVAFVFLFFKECKKESSGPG